MTNIAPAAAAAARISPRVDQAVAQSSLNHIPALAKAAKETHYNISSEMQAWERDHDPEHLLRVIRMQQEIIHSYGHSLVAVAGEAQTAHGVMQVLAAELDRAAGSIGIAANLPVSALNRRAEPAAGNAVERLGTQFLQAAKAQHAVPPMAPHAKADIHHTTAAIEQQQQLLDQLQRITQLTHDVGRQAISNLR